MAAQESRLAIVIDSAGAEARIKALKEQLRELGGAADRAADDTNDLGNSADRASRDTNRLNASAGSGKKALDGMAKAAAVAGVALVGALGLSINKAQSWETAMAEINKTVNFAADDGLANMRKELQALTTQIPQTFEELAAVTATGGQLGIAEKDLIGFTETMAKMGVAFDIPAQQAADSMAKIANVFGIPIANIDRLGDAINTLSNNTPATAAQLIDSLQRVGGVAKVFGLSEDATVGLTGALIAMGKPAEVASGAVNSLLGNLSSLEYATKSQYIGFEKLGVDIDEFSKLVATDGKQAIMTYLDAINALDASERIGVNNLILGKDYGDDITMLAGSIGVLDNNWAMLGETVGTTKEYFGSMDAEFSKISATSANKMVLFKNNIDGVTASIGDAFIPALNDILLAMTPIVTAIGVWTAANPELLKQIISVTAILLGSIVGLKLFADGIMAVKSTIEGLKLGFTVAAPVFKSVFAALTGSIGLPLLAIAALIAAGVLLYQNWDLVKEKASELNEWVKSKFGSLPEPLQQAGRDIAEVFMFIWNTGKEYLTLMSELYSGTFESFKTIAGGALQLVWNNIKLTFGLITSTVSTALQIVATLFSGGFALIKNTVSTVLGVIKAVISGDFKAIPGIIGNGLKGAISIVGNMMGQILDVIKNYGKKLFSLGRDFIGGFVSGIKSMYSGAVSAASTMAGNAIEAVRKRQQSNSPAKATIKLGKDLGDGYIGGIKSKAKAVKTEAQKMADGAIEAVQTGIDRIKKELALFGSNSNLADLDYDIKVGKYNGASDASKNEYRNLVAELEAKNKLAAANKTVQDSIDGLLKQRALFGNSSSLAALMYDIEHTDKYKDATQALTDELLTQTAAFEQLGMTAKATAAIQARFAQLKKDTESTGTAFNGLDVNQPQTEAEKLRLAYEQKMLVVDEYEQLHTDKKAQAEESRKKLTESYNQGIRELELQKQASTVGSLTAMFGMALGETSKGYRAMFAVQQAYDFVQAQSASFTAIAKAWSSAPFPANLPAVATTTLSTGIIPAAISALSPKGFKDGGYTGNMGVNQVAGPVHGQEYVFDAQSTKRIGVDNLNAMRSGQSVGGGDVNINVNVDAKGSSQVSGDNERMGRDMANGIKAVVMDVMRKEKRQGGMLYA